MGVSCTLISGCVMYFDQWVCRILCSVGVSCIRSVCSVPMYRGITGSRREENSVVLSRSNHPCPGVCVAMGRNISEEEAHYGRVEVGSL